MLRLAIFALSTYVRVHASAWSAGAVSQWPKNLVSPLSSSPHSSLQSTMSQDVVLSVGRSVAVGRGRSIDLAILVPAKRVVSPVSAVALRVDRSAPCLFAFPLHCSIAPSDRPPPAAPTPFTAHATCSAMSETSRRTRRTVASRDHISGRPQWPIFVTHPSHQSPFFYVIGKS